MGATEMRVRATAMADENGWNEYKRLVMSTLKDHGKKIDRLQMRIGNMELRLAVGAGAFALAVWIASNWAKVLSLLRGP